MNNDLRRTCGECARESEREASRREFLRRVGVGAAVVGGGLLPLSPGGGAAPWVRRAAAQPTRNSAAEQAVARLYATFSEDQRKIFCLPFGDPLQSRVNPNWAITQPTIDDALNPEQTALVREIVRNVTSPEGYERMMKQMDDDSGGLEAYHIAVFGDPEGEKFSFVLTGRHATLRADGNTVPHAAFGGPIVYGHGEGDGKKGLPGNVFYYQTRKANEVFQALDGKQRDKALLEKAPSETAVQIKGEKAEFPGISVGDLSSDQRELVGSVLKTLLAPYREEDAKEAMEMIEEAGGLSSLHFAFYKSDDLGDDQEWDVWRIEGPSSVFHFRGAPHVHAYINIAKKV